jgi:CHAD domain-containing protein
MIAAADQDPFAAQRADVRELRRRLRRAVRRTRRQADAEAIHDTRVTLRRLEAALDLWRGAIPARPGQRAQRVLRSLRRALGPAREAQVNLALLHERSARLPESSRVAAAFLLERFRRRSLRREREAAEHCRSRTIDRIVRRLRRVVVASGAGTSLAPGWLEGARLLASERLAEARDALQKALEAPDDEVLHRARIAVKRARYLLERLAAAGGSPEAPALAGLRTSQELLGAIHDLAVVRERLLRDARRLAAVDPAAARTVTPIAEQLDIERDSALRSLRALAHQSPRSDLLHVVESNGPREDRGAGA